MFRLISTTALIALAAATLPASTSQAQQPTLPVLDDISWTYQPAGEKGAKAPQLKFTHRGQSTTLGLEAITAMMGPQAANSLESGGNVAFSLTREAGALACSGSGDTGHRATGRCRFDPDEGFADALAQRGIAAKDTNDLFAAFLVDATVERIDGLRREGYEITEFDELLAISALDVSGSYAASIHRTGFAFSDLDNLVAARAVGITPDYIDGLRASGLAVDEDDDLVAAKAVGVDAEWLAAMATAGYPNLDLDRAVELKAMDITPDYARRMARVAAGLESER